MLFLSDSRDVSQTHPRPPLSPLLTCQTSVSFIPCTQTKRKVLKPLEQTLYRDVEDTQTRLSSHLHPAGAELLFRLVPL